MAGAVRVGHHDRQVGLVEGEIVVAAIPQDDIHFLLGLAQDGFVIHAGVDDHAVIEVRFVLLALFDGALVLVQVGIIGEALHLLRDQVAVGHGVADGGHLVAHVAQDQRNAPGGLALARTGAHRADRNDRLGRFEHGRVGTHQAEIRAGGHHGRGLVHHILVRNIAVGKHHLLDLVLLDQALQVALRVNRDALRVQLAGQLSRVLASFDVGDLGGGEGDHLIIRIVAEEDVEIVEVASRGAHDDRSDGGHMKGNSL